MEKLVLRFFLLISFISLASCSGVESGDVVGIDSNTTISDSFTSHDSNSISGSGTVRFDQALSLFSNKSIELKGSLDSALSNSSITLKFYSSSQNLTSGDGINVTFVRNGSSVDVTISFNGTSVTVQSSRLYYFYPSSLDLVVDVHNSGTKARVMIWRRDLIEYSPATADVDTSDLTHISGPLPSVVGQGPYAGLTLMNATVTTARLGSQKVLE